jgi:hypothetical protein
MSRRDTDLSATPSYSSLNSWIGLKICSKLSAVVRLLDRDVTAARCLSNIRMSLFEESKVLACV